PVLRCLPGTHVQTINYLMSWIADCEDRVLWCSGLAGTGKSSLAGTLHDLLRLWSHVGPRPHLVAFFNCNQIAHSEYTKRLIMFIAHSLGMFDQHIGEAIAKALDTLPAAICMPASESHAQFRFLIQEPLETL
ncbi:hypothetical protein EDD18DRAFT_1024515, partial [Armillaria luteobubalina]